jgi:hypothetical protein
VRCDGTASWSAGRMASRQRWGPVGWAELVVVDRCWCSCNRLSLMSNSSEPRVLYGLHVTETSSVMTARKEWADAWRDAGGKVTEEHGFPDDVLDDVAKADADPAQVKWFGRAIFKMRVTKEIEK